MKLSRLLCSLLLAASAVAFTACEPKKTDTPVPPAEGASETISVIIEETSNGVVEQVTDIVEGSTPLVASEPVAATGQLPAACETYIESVTACVGKLSGANKGAADLLQQGLDQTRDAWKQHADTQGLNEACTQLNKTFEQQAKAMGC